MPKYHYNPSTGKVGACRADSSKPNSRGCRFQMSEGEHFSTTAEAAQAYEATQEALPPTASSKTLQSSNGKELSPQQQAFFSKSAVRDPEGRLLEVHHGSATHFDSFDPATLGKGNDTWGNGFYFTTNSQTAESYSGGNGAREFYLAVERPLQVDGKEEMSLDNVQLTREQNLQILKSHPGLHLQPNESDEESNPLEDYSDEYWSREKHTPAQMQSMVDKVAKEYFSEAGWIELESFFGREHGHDFLKAVNRATGYDGVEVNFGADIGKHFVAWFPEQIKLSSNRDPQASSEIAK